MSPPTKKQRCIDTGEGEAARNVDLSLSSDFQIEARTDESAKTCEELKISNMLRSLLMARSGKQAFHRLFKLENTEFVKADSEGKSIELTELICEMDGVATLVSFLKKWKADGMVAWRTLHTFLPMCVYVPKTMNDFVDQGGLKTIFEIVKLHDPDSSYKLYLAALWLMMTCKDIETGRAHKDITEETRRAFASEECINFVLNCMKLWPQDDDIQEYGFDVISAVGDFHHVHQTLLLGGFRPFLFRALKNPRTNECVRDAGQDAYNAMLPFNATVIRGLGPSSE